MATLAATCCAYCGLPVPRAWLTERGDGPAYCCGGCRFAAQVAGADGGETSWMFARLGLALFCTMNVMVFTMALWSSDVYGAADTALAGSLHGLFRYLCLLFGLPVLFWLGGPLAENAWASVKRGYPTTDVLLVAGVAASYLYSAVSVLRDDGPVYFEVGCVVLVLVTLGRWLEATGRARATQALDALERLLPESVRRLEPGRTEIEMPLREVQVGQRLRVRAGERIPCDGVVLDQAAHVDEQLLSGESGGHVKEPGDAVHAGTLNLDSDLLLEVRRAPEAGALSRIVRLTRQAREGKGHYERLADRATAWFLPLVAAIAVGAGCLESWRVGLDQGLLRALAVVLIACPCALGIATPLALWIAQGRAVASQVLFRSNDVLERLARVDHCCFDKTGTVTTGRSHVARVLEDDTDAVCRAVALASSSTHPHARAVAELGAAGGAIPLGRVRTLAGRGVRAEWPDSGEPVFLGSLRLMREQDLRLSQKLQSAVDQALARGDALVCVGWSGSVRAAFVLDEELRPEAVAALTRLREQGIETVLLTGDHRSRADALAQQLGIPVLAELLPEDKLTQLQKLRAAGKIVAMVGDGINDAPALAASDVGIALGCGADVARDAAAVCLLGNDLARLPWAVELARNTVRVVRQNLFFAFIYNALAIPLAACGWLNPVLAACVMLISSGLVLGNSLRLRGPRSREDGACSTVS